MSQRAHATSKGSARTRMCLERIAGTSKRLRRKVVEGQAFDTVVIRRPRRGRTLEVWIGAGTFGYVSEVWIRSADRGGLGLPGC